MEMFERVRELRKNNLKLSQEQFGEKLGVSRSVIKNMELDLLARPEQKEPIIKLICKTFNVSYEWLTTGEGEMFTETTQSFVEKLSSEYGLSFYAQKVIECYLSMEDEQRGAVDSFIKSIAESIAEAPTADEEADGAVDKTIRVFRAAKSDDNAAPEVVDISAERIRKLEEADEADDI